jgi:hypothetical protein
VFKAAAEEQVFEKFLALGVVWSLFEFELAAVGHVLCEFLWVAVTKLLNRRVNLALLNLSVLIVLVSSAKPLPGKLPFKKIQDDISSALKIVSSALFNAQVSVG